MKHKTAHGLSFILIAVLAVLTVATTLPFETIPNILTYETRGEYYFIKAKTIGDPGEYTLFWNVDIFFGGKAEWQSFGNSADDDGKYRIVLYGTEYNYETREYNVIEEILLDEPGLETFTENDLFIVKIRKEFIRYDNYYVPELNLKNKNGGLEVYDGYGPYYNGGNITGFNP